MKRSVTLAALAVLLLPAAHSARTAPVGAEPTQRRLVVFEAHTLPG